MLFTVDRAALLKPLQMVSSVLGGRPTQPIFSNVLIRVEQGMITLTTTDMEVEMVTRVEPDAISREGSTTVPARKLLDICRGLPDSALIQFSVDDDRLTISSGRSKYLLSTLPAADFPVEESWPSQIDFSLTQGEFKALIDASQFSMASQDVRYYLNGMLFEIDGAFLRSVATDGHRLAMAQLTLADSLSATQIIVPRKGVLELMKLLDQDDQICNVVLGESNIRVSTSQTIFTCRLVDGRFPDYNRVIPRNSSKFVAAGRDELRQAFSRAAILSNEKFRGVRLQLNPGVLTITANNPEQEQAEEVIDVSYDGAPLEIGFNVSYMLDVLNNLKSEQVTLCLSDGNSSALIEDKSQLDVLYVVMPMRL